VVVMGKRSLSEVPESALWWGGEADQGQTRPEEILKAPDTEPQHITFHNHHSSPAACHRDRIFGIATGPWRELEKVPGCSASSSLTARLKGRRQHERRLGSGGCGERCVVAVGSRSCRYTRKDRSCIGPLQANAQALVEL
jgi:hypothetical protein